jgi:DNA-binding FadR family transcriptional regulator
MINHINHTKLLAPSQHSLPLTIVHALGVRIIRGEYPPGEALPPEKQLCDEFGVSRSVVREAMKVLAAKGMIIARPRIGSRVTQRPSWTLLDADVLAWYSQSELSDWFSRSLIEVRLIIEPSVAELAAQRATEEEMIAIAAACRSMETAVHDLGAFIDADVRFHAAVLTASHNELLLQLGNTLMAALLLSFRISAQYPGSAAASLPYHRAIVDAIHRHEAPAARAAMQQLIMRSSAEIDQVLQKATPADTH